MRPVFLQTTTASPWTWKSVVKAKLGLKSAFILRSVLRAEWHWVNESARERERNGQGDRERDIKWHKRDITEGGMLPKGIQGGDGGKGGEADHDMKSDLSQEPAVIRPLCNQRLNKQHTIKGARIRGSIMGIKLVFTSGKMLFFFSFVHVFLTFNKCLFRQNRFCSP